LTNTIFASKAKQISDNYALVGTVGYVHRMAQSTWLDFRGSASYGNMDGRAFTDSVGIEVSSTSTKLLNLGGSVGLHHAFNNQISGFVRAGVRWTQVETAAMAFGIKAGAKGQTTAGIIETGIAARISPYVSFQASAFGDVTKSARSLGGSARLAVRF
jgi:outer membrane autotransporter protein